MNKGAYMKTSIPVHDGNTLAALQGFLKQLLEIGLVEALLVPMRTSSGTVTPALVHSPDLLSAADPLAPVMAVNSAAWVGKLSAKEPRPKVGVVLRSCELRALVELAKMQQASLDDLTLIAVDCAGTYSVPSYMKQVTSGVENLWRDLFHAAVNTPESSDVDLRPACRICEQPVYDGARVTVELIGSDLDREIRLSLPEEMASRLELSQAAPNDRPEIVEKYTTARLAARDMEFAAIRERLDGQEGLTGVFAACIRCHNCMTVCPICYCKTCVFRSPVFEHEPMQYVNWAKQKGAHRMPPDTVIFHMTRLNHMSLSCVGCGMCTEACPSELPVGMVFRAIGQRVQETFEYTPGRSLDDALPLVTFKADEWTDVGE